MPDPGRVVRKSLAVLRRLGLSDRSALDVIITVAGRVQQMSSEHSPEFQDWLEDIRYFALRRKGSLARSDTDRKGNDHANG